MNATQGEHITLYVVSSVVPKHAPEEEEVQIDNVM